MKNFKHFFKKKVFQKSKDNKFIITPYYKKINDILLIMFYICI